MSSLGKVINDAVEESGSGLKIKMLSGPEIEGVDGFGGELGTLEDCMDEKGVGLDAGLV